MKVLVWSAQALQPDYEGLVACANQTIEGLVACANQTIEGLSVVWLVYLLL